MKITRSVKVEGLIRCYDPDSKVSIELDGHGIAYFNVPKELIDTRDDLVSLALLIEKVLSVTEPDTGEVE